MKTFFLQVIKRVCTVLAALLMTACTAPGLASLGERYQWQPSTINSKPLMLDALANKAAPPSKTLHIYIEGDGAPFLNRYTVAPDPTPRAPIMPALMAQDPVPAVFLARPCYFRQATFCTPSLWTVARYAPIVVQSMANAIEILAENHENVVLIGHSGGGTLAVLVAAHVNKVSRVITLAGNLDIDAWTRHHALSPLSESLNPAKQAPLSRRVRQVHFVGRDDQNILPEWVAAYTHGQPNATLILVDGFSHRCCWDAHWPTLLKEALQDNVSHSGDRTLALP